MSIPNPGDRVAFTEFSAFVAERTGTPAPDPGTVALVTAVEDDGEVIAVLAGDEAEPFTTSYDLIELVADVPESEEVASYDAEGGSEEAVA